jgi:hypothetical protein
MSAWRIGRESSELAGTKDASQTKTFVDRIVKYIPGDAIVGYTTAITLFALQSGQPSPKLWLALVFVVVTAVLVVLGWLSATPRDPGAIARDLFLAIVAFVVWSLTVPGNGWTEISFIGSNPAIAALVGLIAGIVMPGLAKALGRD